MVQTSDIKGLISNDERTLMRQANADLISAREKLKLLATMASKSQSARRPGQYDRAANAVNQAVELVSKAQMSNGY